MDEFGYSHPHRRRLDEEEFVPGTDAQVVKATFRVYGSAFLIMLVSFCLLRKRYPKLYNVRSWSTVNGLQCALAQKDYGFISWMWKLYLTSDDDLLDQCGMDAVCFLRIIYFGFKVSCIGIFNSIWLLPLYATAQASEETAAVIDPVEELTTSHVPSESRRFIGTVMGAYVLFLWTMYLILQEFEWYTKKRHTFLSRRGPRNYTVYVTGIPEEYRSSGLLLEYFLGCFTRHAVLEAHLAMDIPTLEKLVANRDVLITKLEHALAIKQIRGYNPTHRNLNLIRDLSHLDFGAVDSIEAYENELDEMNKDIREEIRKLLPRPETLQRSHGRRLGEDIAKMQLSPISPRSPRSPQNGPRNRLDSNALQLFPDFSNADGRARIRYDATQLSLDTVNHSSSKDGQKRLGSNALTLFRDLSPSGERKRTASLDSSDLKIPDLKNYRLTVLEDNTQEQSKSNQLDMNSEGHDHFPSEIIDIEACFSDHSFPLQNIDEEEDSSRQDRIVPLPIRRFPIDVENPPDDTMSVDLSTNDGILAGDARVSAKKRWENTISRTSISGTLKSKRKTPVKMTKDTSSDEGDAGISEQEHALRQWNEAMSLTSPTSSKAIAAKNTTAVGIATRKSFGRDESARDSTLKQWNDAESLISNPLKSVTSVDDIQRGNANFPPSTNVNKKVQIHEASAASQDSDDSSLEAARDALKQWNESRNLTAGVSQSLNEEHCSMHSRQPAVEQRGGDDESFAEILPISSDMSRSQQDHGSTVSEVHGALPLESRMTYPTFPTSSESDDESRSAVGRFAGSLLRARDTFTSMILGHSDHIVKAVTGSSQKAVVRHIGEAVQEVNVDNLFKIGDLGVGGIKIAAKQGVKGIKRVQNVGTQAVQEAVHTAVKILNNEDGISRDAGFVVFKKLATTQAALGMIHNSTPYVMNVEEAPEPDDIYWQNVGKSHKSRQLGSVLSFAASATLCFFWTIPVSFISGLTEVDALKDSVPFLEKMIENNPWIERALALVAPLMLIILNSLLPAFLGYFAKLEGHIASSALDASLFVKLSVFQIIQTFFVSAISGGIYAQLTEILDEPGSLVVLLATSLPSQGTFFVQILLVSTFLGQGLELLRVVPLAMVFLRTRIGPNLTKKEREKPVHDWIRPLSDPRPFEHAEVFANVVLYFMVLFVYATISPIISYFVAFCFLIMGCGYRYQFIYNYPTNPDSGGKLWSGFIGICLAAMIIAQLTLVGLLALKKAKYATPCLVPLIIVTICFIMHLRVKHFRVANSLPTTECMNLDRTRSSEDFRFVHGEYLQPALRARDEYPDVQEVELGTGRLRSLSSAL